MLYLLLVGVIVNFVGIVPFAPHYTRIDSRRCPLFALPDTHSAE
jgi:hypothetical protein